MMKKLLLLILLFIFCTQAPGQKYLLPLTLDASNGLPIRDGTFAIYDSTGVTKNQDLYWLSAGYYYYTSTLTPGWYDIKQYVGGSWYTHLNNIWLINTYTFINDSVMYYVNVDGTKITKTDDTLSVGTIDSTDVSASSLSTYDIRTPTANNVVIGKTSTSQNWMKLDSSFITNHSIQNVDLADDLFILQPDSGIKFNDLIASSATVSPSGTYPIVMSVTDTNFTFHPTSRALKIKDGGVYPDELNSTVYDSVQHIVYDYIFAPFSDSYASYDDDSLNVVDTLYYDPPNYIGTFKYIQADGTDSGNLQSYVLRVLWQPKEPIKQMGFGSEPDNVLQVYYQGREADSEVNLWTLAIRQLDGTLVMATSSDIAPASGATWTTKSFTSSDVTIPLNTPLVLEFTVEVATTDQDHWIKFGWIRFIYTSK